MTTETILELEKISCTIAQREILKSVSFSIKKGETAGLIGPNGSGKTTLFNCVSGFIRPVSGVIRLNGADITSCDPYRRAALGIGRVFQNNGVFRDMTVLENMLVAVEGTRNGGGGRTRGAQAREAAMEFLKQINLADAAGKNAASLSGGQMRLLEIARILAFGADLFLLDEPTAGVSPRMKDDVAAIITRLKELGKTVIIIEHDISFIQKFCERILVMNVGSLAMDDTPQAIMKSPLLREIYFGAEFS